MPLPPLKNKTVFAFDLFRLVIDEFVLFDNLSFSIREHESVALVGPTGSGKSLLLAVMQQSLWGAPQQKAQRASNPWRQQGQVTILGHECAPLPPSTDALQEIHSSIAMVRESSAWLPISIAENFHLAQRFTGPSVQSYEEIVDNHAQSPRNRALLLSLAEQMPSEIEAPYLQYLAIIRALVRKPKVLLLDEALIKLDPILLRHAEALLFDKAEKMTLIWATNDLHQASRMTDRTILLLNGKLREDSETTAFFTNPRTTEAEAFISGREPE